MTQQNAEETMPDSTMENVMTKNTSCAPCTTQPVPKELIGLLLEIFVMVTGESELRCDLDFA